MLVTKERFLPSSELLKLSLQAVPHSFDTPEKPASRLSQLKQKVNRLRLTKQPVSANENYLRRFLPSAAANQNADYQTDYQIETALSNESRANILRPDFEHIFREMTRVEKHTVFPMTISTKENQSFGEGYSESMNLLLANFAQEMAKKGLLTNRSMLEHLVFSKTYNRLLEIAKNHQKSGLSALPSSYLFLTSPPGTFVDGYNGIDTLTNWHGQETHHSFSFVFVISGIEDDQISVTVHQYRTWHNMQGLLDLHQKMDSPITIDPKTPITHQILANGIELSFEENTPEAEMLSYFEKTLYETQDTWARRPDQAPHLSAEAEQKFWHELGIYQSQSFFDKLYLQPVLSAFTHQPDAKMLLKQLDLRAQVLLESVELRIRELNTNPKYNSLVKKNLLQALLKQPWRAADIIQQLQALSEKETGLPLTSPERLAKITKAHHLLEQHKVFGRQLTPEELRWLGKNAGSVLAIGNFAFGSMQCFAIGSVQMPLKALSMDMSGSFSTQMIDALKLVDQDTKRELLKEIKAANYVELDLRPQANRVWMVPSSYLAGPGCRVDDRGMVCGPCITPDHPLGIPFDHPLEAANPYGPLPMNQDEFNLYVQTIERHLLESQLADQLDVTNMPEHEANYTYELISRLSNSLLKVSLSSLIAGVTEYTDQAYLLPPEKLAQITSIETLEALVVSLEKDGGDELEELVTIAAPSFVPTFVEKPQAPSKPQPTESHTESHLAIAA